MNAQLESIFFRNDDKQFLIDAVGGGALSFGEVASRAADLTSRFQSAGICRGDRVGIVMPNSVDLIVFYLACLFGGFAAVPVNSALSPKDRIFILSREVKGLDYGRFSAGLCKCALHSVRYKLYGGFDGSFASGSKAVLRCNIRR